MSAQPSVLAPAYTCNICRKTLTMQGPTIIGETPESRLGRLSQMLTEHLGTEHKDRMVQIMLAGNSFAGWLIWEQFKHNNAELQKESDIIRIKTRAFTKRVHVPDDKLESQVNTHLAFMSDAAKSTVIALLKGLRDTLEEVQPA